MAKLGNGVLTWNRYERVGNRYGCVYLGDHLGDNHYVPNYGYDIGLANSFVGQKVKITCKVIEPRESRHIGDLFLGVGPTLPEAGEEIALGVGEFFVENFEEGNKTIPMFGLKPSDGREELWLDPEKLYRLHDQTVTVHIEPTDEPEETEFLKKYIAE